MSSSEDPWSERPKLILFSEENELLVEENQELVAGQVEDELNGNQSVENSQLTTLVTCL